LKLLYSEKGTLLFDEKKNLIIEDNKEIELDPLLVLNIGDTINYKSTHYVLLDFVPQLYSKFGKRMAQIIDGTDSSYMLMMSGITDGSRVLESGTGSGYLTTAILNIIGNSDLYLGVDHRESSANKTKENVEYLCGKKIQIEISNFEDFSYKGNKLDALFLDLPEPWKNVGEQRKWLGSGKKVITYLPTYNQLEKTVFSYVSSGFLHLESVELNRREILVREGATRPVSEALIHTGFISTFVKKSGSTIRIKKT
jgi:tRNA (adenine57-N1/adenine58-N1)-methyltransferase